MKVTASTEAELEVDPPCATSAADLARWAARGIAQALGALAGVLLEDVSSTAAAAGGTELLQQLAFMKILTKGVLLVQGRWKQERCFLV